MIAEVQRLAEDATREKNWKRWGPYLAERQWAIVREDYSPDGAVWDYFPHEHARSRAYRWGEDGLLGITDRECRLCFALALWNGKDPILKERLFGLTGPQGMHPNGQLPAYEFNFADVNPPVHAWSCWRVYKMTAARGHRDRVFLSRCFQKLVINFTWWVNRKDLEGHILVAGGFLGLDNIGVFDRSKPLPTGGHLQQADGTAWMAFYCATMLSIALELARENPATEDMASKFFEHFVAIADAMNTQGGAGLWDEEDGF